MRHEQAIDAKVDSGQVFKTGGEGEEGYKNSEELSEPLSFSAAGQL